MGCIVNTDLCAVCGKTLCHHQIPARMEPDKTGSDLALVKDLEKSASRGGFTLLR